MCDRRQLSKVVLWSGQGAAGSDVHGNFPAGNANALAWVKSAQSGCDSRRIAGTTVVLTWAQASRQACYEAECQTKTGRARRLAVGDLQGVGG